MTKILNNIFWWWWLKFLVLSIGKFLKSSSISGSQFLRTFGHMSYRRWGWGTSCQNSGVIIGQQGRFAHHHLFSLEKPSFDSFGCCNLPRPWTSKIWGKCLPALAYRCCQSTSALWQRKCGALDETTRCTPWKSANIMPSPEPLPAYLRNSALESWSQIEHFATYLLLSYILGDFGS